MHGIIRPAILSELDARETARQRLKHMLWPYRWFLGLVILPTLLVAGYYYLIASDQYESKADFVVRKADAGAMGGGGIGQVLGFSIGSSQTQSEAYVVEDYLLSHDAVAVLRKEDRLVDRFQRPDVDLLSRLHFANPKPENLLKYYRKHVDLTQDSETGITHLSVRAFTPDDAFAISSKLLRLGEARINDINVRTYRGQIAAAQRELADAEMALGDIQRRITGFRQSQGDINPAGTGQAQITMVTTLTANVVAARARLNSMDGLVSRSSPQYRALSSQVRALEAQVAGQSARLTGRGQTIASSLGNYEDLVVRQEFAAKRYTAAAASYQQSRAEALKQQLYLIRVVDANLPVKSLFPERGRIVLTVFLSLLVAYGIGWLLVAGVKEHSL
jgi:capsular polysaccharide transport system permease protein